MHEMILWVFHLCPLSCLHVCGISGNFFLWGHVSWKSGDMKIPVWVNLAYYERVNELSHFLSLSCCHINYSWFLKVFHENERIYFVCMWNICYYQPKTLPLCLIEKGKLICGVSWNKSLLCFFIFLTWVQTKFLIWDVD